MARHRITTASLLQAIDDQRAEEASARWDEISREYMSDEDAAPDLAETVHASTLS
jgi:hypothetical protein